MVVSEQPLCEIVELEAPELPLVSPRGIVELAPHTPPVQLFYRIEGRGSFVPQAIHSRASSRLIRSGSSITPGI